MDGMDLTFVKTKIGSTKNIQNNMDELKVEVTVSANRANRPLPTTVISRPEAADPCSLEWRFETARFV